MEARRVSEGSGIRSSRDLLAYAFVAALAIAWYCDSRYLASQIRDQDSDWTMRLAHEADHR